MEVENNKKYGVMTNAEQDKAIFELIAELRTTNVELNHTNKSVDAILKRLDKENDEFEGIKKDIANIYKILATYGVWIGIASAVFTKIILERF